MKIVAIVSAFLCIGLFGFYCGYRIREKQEYVRVVTTRLEDLTFKGSVFHFEPRWSEYHGTAHIFTNCTMGVSDRQIQ